MFDKIKPHRKAVVAGLLAFGAVVYAAMTDDVITGQEWVEAVMAGLAGSGVTWLVPNTPKATANPGAVRPRTGSPLL